MKRSPGLILGSTSSARRALLEALRVPFTAVSPNVDEEVPPGTRVVDAVSILANRKAEAVAARHPDAWVIGSDQLAEVDGEALGKPEDRAAARAQLRRLSGRTHRLHTGLCLTGPDFRDTLVETVSLTLHPLGDDELERYLDLEEWIGCAGGYRIEGAGQALMASLEGDRATVMGLPVLALTRLLRARGYPFFTAG